MSQSGLQNTQTRTIKQPGTAGLPTAHLEGDLMPGEAAWGLLAAAADSSLPDGCRFASISADTSGASSDCFRLGAELLVPQGLGGLPLPALWAHWPIKLYRLDERAIRSQPASYASASSSCDACLKKSGQHSNDCRWVDRHCVTAPAHGSSRAPDAAIPCLVFFSLSCAAI